MNLQIHNKSTSMICELEIKYLLEENKIEYRFTHAPQKSKCNVFTQRKKLWKYLLALC